MPRPAGAPTDDGRQPSGTRAAPGRGRDETEEGAMDRYRLDRRRLVQAAALAAGALAHPAAQTAALGASIRRKGAVITDIRIWIR